MKVYALTGPSGTGKSYQAMALCNEKNIAGLIDDGLFIYGGRVEAGISAKRQKTKVGAIKTALFTEDSHCREVRRRISEILPDSLLIIGTSDRMASKIADRLMLPEISEWIHIEDITSEEERQTALRHRNVQGKHIIPVPTMQLKRAFAGYFMSPLRRLRTGFFGGAPAGPEDGNPERTVVRPTFSYMGDFFISDRVISDIAKCVAEESPGVEHVLRVYENTAPDSLHIDVSVAMRLHKDLWANAEAVQNAMEERVEYMTAFNVVRVNVEVRKVI